MGFEDWLYEALRRSNGAVKVGNDVSRADTQTYKQLVQAVVDRLNHLGRSGVRYEDDLVVQLYRTLADKQWAAIKVK
jgi:hypothetical protein